MKLVTFRGSQYDSSPRALLLPGPIKVNSPISVVWLFISSLQLGPIIDEVHECLRFDHYARYSLLFYKVYIKRENADS